jgi:Glycosyltransferase family 9 (heptosyltransferase)
MEIVKTNEKVKTPQFPHPSQHGQIVDLEKDKLNPTAGCSVPAWCIPDFRTAMAIQAGVERNILIKTWGGLGDQICAEPTMRFALKTFKDCDVSLATPYPELFAHLKFKKVYNLSEYQPHWERYFVFDTIVSPQMGLTWQFMSHMLTNCVDFPSLCAFRCQLPIEDRIVDLKPPTPTNSLLTDIVNANVERMVLVHAGRHWPSKTFPKDWWDDFLSGLLEGGAKPVLIGADTDDNRGTVDVNAEHCIDLRNKTSRMETVWLTHQTKVLFTNDSAPLHMAVPSPAWIGFVATCKHFDYISHWRRNLDGRAQWSWRMENLGRGGLWDVINHCPNKGNEVTAEKVEESMLRTWLPEPQAAANWCLEKL